MKRRHVFIDGESATTATTRVIDLDLNDPISRLVVEYKGTNNGSVPTAHGAKMVSKIEIVDGSDTLASVSGLEAQAAAILETGQSPFVEQNYQDDVQNIQAFHIRFGRWLWDKALALDPKRFRNPQLKITHNKASGGSAPDASTMSVFADIMEDENPALQGFLSLREIRSYSLTSSAEERVELPVDEIIRRVIILSLSAGKQPWEQYNKVKLTADNDKKVLINNAKTSDLLKILEGNPQFVEAIRVIDVDSETTVYITPTYNAHLAGNGLNASETTLFFDESYGGSVDMTAGAAGAVDALVHGQAPHGALSLPMGKPDEIADWLDPRQFKKLEAVLTAGSSVGSSSTCEVVAETVRRY